MLAINVAILNMIFARSRADSKLQVIQLPVFTIITHL